MSELMPGPLGPADVVGALVVVVALAGLAGVGGVSLGDGLGVSLVVIGLAAILGPRTFRAVIELRTGG
ncbi:hypothetical protein [Salinirubrum litoreum]|uniref:Uncharacterized protein n=1 Tax=Salinirubrum litoreum TaxID=1126234 RepID=A0ABD5R9A1_9EURY|nr:hypothetical protein [Salinirubrum litoreum]